MSSKPKDPPKKLKIKKKNNIRAYRGSEDILFPTLIVKPCQGQKTNFPFRVPPKYFWAQAMNVS